MVYTLSNSAAAKSPNWRLTLATSPATFAIAFVLSLVSQASHIAAQGAHIIAISGDPAPDGNGTFFDFRRPQLNEAGQLAFSAYLIGTTGGFDDDTGIFRGEPGVSLSQIARERPVGTFTSGLSDVSIATALNDSGQVAFTATYQPGSSFGGPALQGEFRGSGGSLTHIALEGNAAPGGSGTFSRFYYPAINEAGEVAFLADIDTSESYDESGIFRGTGGPVTRIARQGQAAPDGNGTLGSFAEFPALNKSGQVAFGVHLQGTSGGNTDSQGIFRGSGGALTQIARAGQTAPDGNGIFIPGNFLGNVQLNDSGQAAFWLELTGTSGGTKDDSGIFLGDGGPITQIAREGDIAPDGDGHLEAFWYPALNNAGEVAFTAGISGTKGGLRDGEGVFSGAGRRLTQIARTGQNAPDGNGAYSFFELAPELTDAGHVAFRAGLNGTSGGSNDNVGLFFYNGVELQEVARTGQALGGSIINGLSLSNDAINEHGQVAYRAHLLNGKEAVVLWTAPALIGDYNMDGVVDAADYVVWRKHEGVTYTQNDYTYWRAHFGQSAGSGASIIANTTVPEPATAVLLLIAAILATSYRRRAVVP
jgi:hypothetical protein